MSAGQTLLIALTVDGNVLLMPSLELLDRSLDVLHATLDTHVMGREVAVKTSSVPVTRDGLGLHRDLHTKLLRNPVKKETSHPQVVTHLNTFTRANLELPLGRHDLGVGTGDLDASIQASLVVSLNDITANNLASTYTTVVGSLGRRETLLGPAVWSVIHIEEGVFLLQSEPRLLGGVRLHQLCALMTVVVLVRCAVRHPSLSQDKDVRDTSEGVGEDSDGLQVDIRIATGGLVGRGTIEVPDG